MLNVLRSFPGSSGRIVAVPDAGRGAWRLTAISGATSRTRVAGLLAGAAVLRIVGTRPLPRVKMGSELTYGVSVGELERQICRQIFSSFQLVGLRIAPQARRRRIVVLGRQRGGLVLIKLGPQHEALAYEAETLRALRTSPIPTVNTPRVMGSGRLQLDEEEITFVATSVDRSPLNFPSFTAPLATIAQALTNTFGAVAPDGVPSHWVPCHGDLAPWNLRRTSRGLALFDWESAGWAPPEADSTYFHVCSSVLRNTPLPRLPVEAAEYWQEIIRQRSAEEDRHLNTLMSNLLADNMEINR